MQPWITDELQTADLGDERLEARFRLLLDSFSRKPSLSVPAACSGAAEVKGAYRFVNHPAVTPDTVLGPHHHATLRRIRQHPVVLIPQDTTELDVTRPRQQMRGAGPLNDSSRLGFYLHPSLALTPDGLPLGVVHAKIWARDPDEFAKTAQEKAAQRKKKSIDAKESVRWLEGYRHGCSVAAACPDTQIICLSDSEGDIFECFFAAEPGPDQPAFAEPEPREPAAAGPAPPQRKADWIIRACEDRALVQGRAEQAPVGRLFAQVASTAVLTTLTLQVRARPAQSGDGRKRKQARSAREATVTVQAARVTLRQPARPGGKKMADVAVNAVLVREVEPPAGEEPIEWLLLSSLPIGTLDEVVRVVEYYCRRWQIEIYFKVLKSGCQVESSQLEDAGAFLPYAALYLIVAWRVLYLLMLGRECPELPCDLVLEEAEWQSVYAVVKGQEPPAEAPPLGEMVKLIARLGGYLGRQGDGPAGPKAMWIGLQRMSDLALGWRARSRQPDPSERAPSRPGPKKASPKPPAHPPPSEQLS
jgi:hypothetical protein